MRGFVLVFLIVMMSMQSVVAADESFLQNAPVQKEPEQLTLPEVSVAEAPDPLDEESFLYKGNLPINKVVVNVTLLDGQKMMEEKSFVDSAAAHVQLLSPIREDAGVFAVCNRAYGNDSSLFPRGSSVLVYVSSLSFRCPNVPYVQLELEYEVKNAGLALLFPNVSLQKCDVPWFSSSEEKSGKETVVTPFMQEKIIAEYRANASVKGKVKVPVRKERIATDFQRFSYASPGAAYLEAFRGNEQGEVKIFVKVLRCLEREEMPFDLSVKPDSASLLGTPKATFGMKFACWFSFLKGERYGECTRRKVQEKIG